MESEKQDFHKRKIRLYVRVSCYFEVDGVKLLSSSVQGLEGEELVLECRDGEFEIYFKNPNKLSSSAGRKSCRCTVKELLNVRILADVLSVEIF